MKMSAAEQFDRFMTKAEELGIVTEHARELYRSSHPRIVDEPQTCADAAAITAALFQIGDVVRLKSERRQMTVSSVGCVDICCMWMNGDALDEADFHHAMLTKAPYPDELPF